jgi:hypothetical protein
MGSVRIDECRAEDLERLEEAIPSGLSRFHERRLARQQLGTSTYLIAWIDEVPVGHAEIRWNGCEAAEVSPAGQVQREAAAWAARSICAHLSFQ